MTRSGPKLTISRLRVYPVKGAQGTDLRTMAFDDVGPRHDRRWMVVGPDGGFVTQRMLPRLATVRPGLAGDTLWLAAPGADDIAVPAFFDGPPLRVRVWEADLDAKTGPPDADEWLSDVLRGPYRLVYMGDDTTRPTDPLYAEGHRVSFADGYPALVVGQGSLDALARRAGRLVPANRFRPNVVVEGTRPHEEDRWQRFRAGGMEFSGVKLCSRCNVTTLDQQTGVPDPASEPLRTLASYRQIESKVYFGLNIVHHGSGQLRIGDEVEVLERGIIPGAWL